jgi:hypothetical protein
LLDFAAPPQTLGTAIPHFGARAKPAGRGRAGRAAYLSSHCILVVAS